MDDLTKFPSTPAEARELGVTRFLTAYACTRGHRAPRYTSTGACTACVAEDKKGKYRDRVKKYHQDYMKKYNAKRKAANTGSLKYATKMARHWVKKAARLKAAASKREASQ